MKLKMFTLAFVVLTAASCSKDDSMPGLSGTAALAAPGKENAMEKTWASGWETYSEWNPSDSSRFRLFIHPRSIPEITPDIVNGGAVLVWAKNMRDVDGTLLAAPRQLPFSLEPGPGRPLYHEYYYHRILPGSVQLQYRTDKHQYILNYVPQPPSAVQYRYIVVPAAELKRLGHTAVSILRLPYEELVRLLQIGA